MRNCLYKNQFVTSFRGVNIYILYIFYFFFEINHFKNDVRIFVQVIIIIFIFFIFFR